MVISGDDEPRSPLQGHRNTVESATAAMNIVSIDDTQPPSQPLDGLQHPPSPQMSSAVDPSRTFMAQERENFLIFIKILFKILEGANEPHTKNRAKRIVLECRRRSQEGDPNYNPLMAAVESRLRPFVGEATWRRAHILLHHFISKNRRPITRCGTPESTNPHSPLALREPPSIG